MKQKIYILTLFVLTKLSLFGQVSDTSFYPTGQIRELKIFQGDKILKAITYKPEGQIKYEWDIDKKELKSFDVISYTDTLAEYFKSNCPDYTLYQHYGNGPIFLIEQYKGNKRHGTYREFDRNGNLISSGQFDNWKKVGIWTYYDPDGKKDWGIHWFHPDYSDYGISISYTVIPVSVTILLIVTVLILYLKYSSFLNFYVSYSISIIGLFALLYILDYLMSEETMIEIGFQIGKYFFSIITTLTLSQTFFSLTSLIFKKWTGIKRRFSTIFLLINVGLIYLLIGAYVGSKVTGVVM